MMPMNSMAMCAISVVEREPSGTAAKKPRLVRAGVSVTDTSSRLLQGAPVNEAHAFGGFPADLAGLFFRDLAGLVQRLQVGPDRLFQGRLVFGDLDAGLVGFQRFAREALGALSAFARSANAAVGTARRASAETPVRTASTAGVSVSFKMTSQDVRLRD